MQLLCRPQEARGSGSDVPLWHQFLDNSLAEFTERDDQALCDLLDVLLDSLRDGRGGAVQPLL